MRSRLSRFLLYRLAFLIAGNALLLIAIRLLIRQGGSFSTVLVDAGFNVTPRLLAGLGMTGIIFCGAIDLSIGAIIAVAGTVFGILVQHGAPPPAAYAGCVATAWLLSVVNGGLVRLLKLPAIIITLAGLTVYRGLALILADISIANFSGNISVQDDAYHGPGKFHAGWILIAGVAAGLLLEAWARAPRLWLARGNSVEACRLQGLDPGRILQGAFVAGGAFLGLAALVEATQIQAIEPARMALGFELPVIGAIVLGGTNIFGGEGSHAGTVLGAFFLYFTEQLLVYGGVSPYWRDVLVGGTILAVIGIDCLLHRKRKLLEELR